MKAVWLIAVQEFIANARRPGLIIVTLAIPLLALAGVVLASLFGGQVGDLMESQFAPEQKTVGYVDHSGLLADPLPQYREGYRAFPDEESARLALLADEIGGFAVVPADYLETGNVTVYGKGGGFSTFVAADSGDLPTLLRDHLLAGKVDDATRARALAPARIQTVTLDEQGQVDDKGAFSWLGDFVLPYAFALLFIITIYSTSGYLLQGVSEEKEGRIIEILLSSISPTQLLAGKILGLGALGLAQILFWIASGAGVLMITVALFALVGAIKFTWSTVFLGLIFFLLGYLLYATLMAIAGSMGSTQREGQQISGIFMFIASIPLFAMSAVFTNPNGGLAVTLSYIPFTAPVIMLMRLAMSPVPAIQILISIAIQVVTLAVILWAGAKVFRVGLLMYGKRPSVKELAQAFKQA
jgi:ABC-2 type transport system permease protein